MEYEIRPKNKLTFGFGELWHYRELFYYFTWRDIKVKYKQTVLGFAWAILQPFIMMLIFTFFFGKVINLPNSNLPYPIFVLSGILLWNIFSNGLSMAGNSMISNAAIIKKIYFPRLIIPASAILAVVFDFLIALIIYFGMLIYYQVQVSILHLSFYTLLGLIITVFTTFGLGTLIASLNIKYRDFKHILPFFIQALLFLTPVIYPISILKEKNLQYVFAINPMFGAIELFRGGINGGSFNLTLIVISLCSASIFFIGGVLYFRKTESYFADFA
jgi:lipopolysaccharide transport system permease protein